MLRYTALQSNHSAAASAPLVAARSAEPAVTQFSLHSVPPWPPARSSAIKDGSKSSALVTKLSALVLLNAEETDALETLSHRAKPLSAEKILIHEGCPTNSVYLIVGGLACRYKMLAGGRRQILGYLIPGDLCDAHFAINNHADHSVALVGDSSVARIPTWHVAELIARYPKIGQALTLASIVDSIILREWLLSVGQRNAVQKLSHFFCEMAARLESVDATSADGSFELPVNQVTLADTLGLTSVHINRTLQRLRNDGLIRLCQRRLTILDRERLAAVAGFDGAYLRVGSRAG